LCKFDSAGNLIWQRQIGTTTTDNGEAVATDKLGNVYLSGRTFGNLAGPNAGSSDAFLTKFDSAGSLLWTRQLGTAAGDEGDSVAVDGAGNVYISGGTTGSLGPQLAGQQDAFLSKYDSNGNLQWVRQLGTTADDYSSATAADSLGNVFIAGQTRGSLGGTLSGTTDAFVSKFDSTGALQWTRQFGGAGSDAALGLSTDGSNNVYVTGDTEVFGTNYYNGFDVFLRKLNGEGTVKWTAALGATYDDLGLAASVDGIGGIYVAGYSNASLTNQTAAGPAFIAKFVDIPEPNIASLLLVGACGLLVLCRAPVQFCFPVTPESRHNASRPPTKDFRPFTS
jgi:hypothetical protein